MAERLSVVIVDDEEPARQVLREFVARDDRFTVVGECDGGASAVDVVGAQRPDVVLLDVQMPEVDGFEVLARLAEPLPAIIMVTAFHEHAVRAFDHHALDYLLKPVVPARLQVALDRACVRVREQARANDEGLSDLRGSLRAETPQRDRITLKAGSGLLFLQPRELVCIEASGNYLRIEHGGRKHLVRESLAGLLARLDQATFLRVHRSFVVHRDAVVGVRAQPGGSDYVLELETGAHVPIGRSYRKEVLAQLGD